MWHLTYMYIVISSSRSRIKFHILIVNNLRGNFHYFSKFANLRNKCLNLIRHVNIGSKYFCKPFKPISDKIMTCFGRKLNVKICNKVGIF